MSHLPRHMPALDGLRGVAILLVMSSHVYGGWGAARSIYAMEADAAPTFAVPGWVQNVAGNGVHGVTLFFVVSAFTLTLSRGQGGSMLGYALRRIARVGPAYWLAGIVYTVLGGVGPRSWAPEGISLPDIAIAAGFGSAWQGGASLAVVPGGWSVSCEVSFYLALLLALRLFEGRVWRAALLTAVWAAALQVIAHAAKRHDGWSFTADYINPLTQAPVFLFGITVALLARRVSLPPMPGVALALLVVAVAALPFSPIGSWILLPHLPFAAVAAALVLVSAQHPPPILGSRPLRRVGEVSYSMYLIHFGVLAPSLAVCEALFPSDGWPTLLLHMALTTGATFGLACLSYRFIEQPAIRWAGHLVESLKRKAPNHDMAAP